MFYVFDIESLGVESTTVVLSAAIIAVEPETLDSSNAIAFDQLVDTAFIPSACFVKFDSISQTKSPYNRTIDPDTLQWWKKQSEVSQKKSLLPMKGVDLSVPDGVARIREFIQSHSGTDEHIIWTRGSLDQMAIDSLCKAYGIPPIAKYNAYRDIRTAIDIIYDTGKNGYVEVPGFPEDKMIAHDPVHDCARDALMLVRGK